MSAYPRDLVTGDFNTDGIQDLAVANSGDNNLSILMGNGSGGRGNGTFAAAANYGTGTAPAGIAAGDFNSDGITDLAVTNGSDNAISILSGLGSEGVGTGTFDTAVDYLAGSNPTALVAGRFNADWIDDLIIVNYTSFDFSVLHGNGNP